MLKKRAFIMFLSVVPVFLYANVSHAMTCRGEIVNVDLANMESPTNGPDVIRGTQGDDVIDALDGDDIVCGRGGNDTITGGKGDDMIYGGQGDDTISGGEGSDLLSGGNGDDTIYAVDESVSGGGSLSFDPNDVASDTDKLLGGRGEDWLYGSPGVDEIRGGTGDDKLFGFENTDELFGHGGDDLLCAGVDSGMSGSGPTRDLVRGGSETQAVLGDICAGGNQNNCESNIMVGEARLTDDDFFDCTGNSVPIAQDCGTSLITFLQNGGTIDVVSIDEPSNCTTVTRFPQQFGGFAEFGSIQLIPTITSPSTLLIFPDCGFPNLGSGQPECAPVPLPSQCAAFLGCSNYDQ